MTEMRALPINMSSLQLPPPPVSPFFIHSLPPSCYCFSVPFQAFYL